MLDCMVVVLYIGQRCHIWYCYYIWKHYFRTLRGTLPYIVVALSSIELLPSPDCRIMFILYFQAPNPVKHWRSFFTITPLLAIYVAHFCMNWTSYVIMHWLPTYLHTTLNANTTDLSLACLPYILNSLCSIGMIYLLLHCMYMLL